MGINWRSQIDIDEENRYGRQYDPNRVTAVLTAPCTKCGGDITEIQYADGRRSYDTLGVTSLLGEGLKHSICPVEQFERQQKEYQ